MLTITVIAVIVFISTLIAYSAYRFDSQVKKEVEQLYERSVSLEGEIVTEASMEGLPSVIQKWLRNCGALGKPLISQVHLTQNLLLKMKPEQTKWVTGTAEQHFSVQPPAFNWTIATQMNPLLKVSGRDKFENGKGEMIIKLLSLLSVAKAKDDQKVDQASLQRYLAEIVWFPTAALSEFIQWEEIDAYSARAFLRFKGTEGSGVFHFDENGNFLKFTAMRFKDIRDQEPKLWTVVATKLEERDGWMIPVECEAKWKLENQNWTWLKLKLNTISYHS